MKLYNYFRSGTSHRLRITLALKGLHPDYVPVDLLHGENGHHCIEAVFKALGRALAQAVAPHAQVSGQLSSKGTL